MRERRDRAEHAGIADENVEPAPALMDRPAEPVERVVIPEIAGDQRRRRLVGRPQRADGVVEFLQRALGAGEGDDMHTLGGQRQRYSAADAARGAGHDGDPDGGGRGGAGHRRTSGRKGGTGPRP